ncbi:hypothetical protein CGQ24_06000 [Arthrobacter sp. 7749]|nr:hypothetical protein CGQ24_06000 [Arthrobacter sp. 7749]
MELNHHRSFFKTCPIQTQSQPCISTKVFDDRHFGPRNARFGACLGVSTKDLHANLSAREAWIFSHLGNPAFQFAIS